MVKGFPGGSEVKASAWNVGDPGSIPGSGRSPGVPWGKKWQCTPVFLSRKFHGQRSLVGYSPRGHKESNMTERLTFSLHGLLDMECEKKSLYPLSLTKVGIQGRRYLLF